jgi:hypothetical protein
MGERFVRHSDLCIDFGSLKPSHIATYLSAAFERRHELGDEIDKVDPNRVARVTLLNLEIEVVQKIIDWLLEAQTEGGDDIVER